MRARALRDGALVVSLVAAALLHAPADAQTVDYQETIRRALDAYDAGRWAEALSAFQEAHAISPSARTLRGIGIASFNMGDYAGWGSHRRVAMRVDRTAFKLTLSIATAPGLQPCVSRAGS